MNEEDPLTMYIAVRESLNMSLGKTCIQVGHVTQRLQQKYQELFNEADSYLDPIYRDIGYELIPKDILDKLNIYNDWVKVGIRKVSLRADEKEWVKLKELPDHILIVDAGHTELAPGTETVIGFWPMLKSQRPKILKRLQAL